MVGPRVKGKAVATTSNTQRETVAETPIERAVSPDVESLLSSVRPGDEDDEPAQRPLNDDESPHTLEHEHRLQRALQREQELIDMLKLRKVEDRIAELESQLRASEVPSSHRRTDVGEKRPAERNSSDDDSSGEHPTRHGRTGLRSKPPPEYRGKNIREHKEFIRACELVFRESPAVYRTDAAKVLMALPYLKGEPADAYEREEQRLGLDCHTWESFSKFLLDNIADPVNRLFTIAQQHEDAMQGPHQKVMEFVTYLERLESELDPYTETQKQQILLTKLRPELRRLITNHQTVPKTRLELARLAARLEENSRSQAGDKPSKMRRSADPSDSKSGSLDRRPSR